MRRILGVQPGLDGVTGVLEVGLAERQALASGDGDLQRDEVDARDRLGHRMLDLEPGVHLEEEGLLGLALP